MVRGGARLAGLARVRGGEAADLARPRDPDELSVLRDGGGRSLPAGRRAARARRGGSMMIWVMLGVLLATMLAGIPILLCIALVSFLGIAAEPGVVMPLFAQKTFAQLDSYTLLALPFFILAGSLMSAGGMSQQLVDFSRVLVGHFRAGLAHASIVASMVFAGISSSSTADASAISAIVIPTMKRSGYKPGFAAAPIACAGTIGAIIPPSMVMVVYGAIAQVSIGGLLLGGIIPGFLIG